MNTAWPTRDKVIPWRLFAALVGRVPEVAALDRLVTAQAVAAGIGVAMSDKGELILKDLARQAFPEGEG